MCYIGWLEKNEFKKYEMLSWTLEEYTDACQNPDFIKCNLIQDAQSTRKETQDAQSSESSMDEIQDAEPREPTMDEIIERKFFLAGSCARWFFGKKVDDVVADINTFVRTLSDVSLFCCKVLVDQSLIIVPTIFCLLMQRTGMEWSVIMLRIN